MKGTRRQILEHLPIYFMLSVVIGWLGVRVLSAVDLRLSPLRLFFNYAFASDK